MYLQQRSYRRPCCLAVIKRSLEQLIRMIPRNKTRTRTRRTVGAGFNEKWRTITIPSDVENLRRGSSVLKQRPMKLRETWKYFATLNFFNDHHGCGHHDHHDCDHNHDRDNAVIRELIIMIVIIMIWPAMELPCKRLNSCNERWEWEPWSKRRPLRIRHSL